MSIPQCSCPPEILVCSPARWGAHEGRHCAGNQLVINWGGPIVVQTCNQILYASHTCNISSTSGHVPYIQSAFAINSHLNNAPWHT